MPTISAPAEDDRFNEDLTLLTLYNLAGEESSQFLSLRPRVLKAVSRHFFPQRSIGPGTIIENVEVRELNPSEMVRAERELWRHYQQQKADLIHDRLFAVFSGQRIIGVARCSRHDDGLEVDAVYVIDEYRLKGFARSVMKLLIEECGRSEPLYMRSRPELIPFYESLGFYQIECNELPHSIRDRAGSFSKPTGTYVAMRRQPGSP